MTKLVCPDCRHENEPERIYCHNCGARLDRAALAKEKAAPVESEAATQQRLKKLFDPARGRGKRLLGELTRTVLYALAVAALIVLLSPPPDLPPASRNYDFAPMINMDLVSAQSSGQTAALVYTEEQVNSYLSSVLRRKDSPASQGYFPLRRLFVQFREGECAIHSERQIFGYPIHSGATYQVTVGNGRLTSRATSAYIGRMQIHPSIARVTDPFLQKAWATLARERTSVARLAGIEFHPQSVKLVSAP